MRLWIVRLEPKCRIAIPSIVSPLCTEYANVSGDFRLGFPPWIRDASARYRSRRRRRIVEGSLLASPSFGRMKTELRACGSAPLR